MSNINLQPRSSGVIDCPVCKQPILQTKMGVASHLRSHVKRKLISNDEKIQIERKLVGRTIV